MELRPIAVIAAFLMLTANAYAAPIPEPVIDMIRAAGPDRIDTIADVAKTANPESVAEIDSLVASIKEDALAQEQAALASQDFFEGWSGEGQIGGSVTSGNTKNAGVAVGVRLAKDGLQWRHAIDASADYQRTNGVKTRESFRFGYEADYVISDTWYAYGLVQRRRDKFAGIQRRFTESLGIGHIVIDSPSFEFEINGGPALRQTRLVATPTLPERSENRLTFRGSAMFAWTISEGLRFTEEFGTLAASGNTTLYSRAALTAALIDVLSARLSFDVEHETSPPPGVVKTDTLTRATLVYDF